MVDSTKLPVEMAMGRFVRTAIAAGALGGGLFSALMGWSAQSSNTTNVAMNDRAVLDADRALQQAIGKSDRKALATLLDASFRWTDSAGKTGTKAQVLRDLAAPPKVIESDAAATERTYGQVALVTAGRNRLHVLRLWVKRKADWRALVYQETMLPAQPPPPPPEVDDSVICENPCKTVPYVPKSAAERGVLAAWQAMASAVKAHEHDDWPTHVADEFLAITPRSPRPLTRDDRYVEIGDQESRNSGPLPAALVSAQMFVFGDTVVMLSQQQPRAGQPFRTTRLWVNRPGRAGLRQNEEDIPSAAGWELVFSQQTSIQTAPAKPTALLLPARTCTEYHVTNRPEAGCAANVQRAADSFLRPD